MNVLLMHTDDMIVEELQEWSKEISVIPYMADSKREAFGILAQHPVDLAIVTLRTAADLELLTYINTSYRHIEVILAVENPLQEIVSVLKHGNYTMLQAPFTLSDLKTSVKKASVKGKMRE